jgi:replicative DNA helicase
VDNILDAECYVLGAMMIGGEKAAAKVSHLQAEHFTDLKHRWLFGVLMALNADRTPIDVVTVHDYLVKRHGERGREAANYAQELDAATPGASNIAAYAKILTDRHTERKTREIAATLADNPTQDGAHEAMKALLSLSSSEQAREHTMRQAVKAAWEEIEAAFAGGGKLRGITTGLPELDDYLGGFHPGDLIIIGARPAMGKTALLLSMAQAADAPRGFVSAEQSSGQIGQRAIAMESRIPVSALRAGHIQEEDFPMCSTAIARLTQQDCVIYDKPAPTLSEVVHVARRWKVERNIQILYVDYVQRIKHGNAKQPRHERVAEVAEGLKELARELNIPVVALAQVNRAVEERPNKRPNMGDLSDSSALEKEADQVIMLYRDEVYKPDSEHRGTAELILEKNRHGGIGMIRVAFNAPIVKFSGMSGRASWDDAA